MALPEPAVSGHDLFDEALFVLWPHWLVGGVHPARAHALGKVTGSILLLCYRQPETHSADFNRIQPDKALWETHPWYVDDVPSWNDRPDIRANTVLPKALFYVHSHLCRVENLDLLRHIKLTGPVYDMEVRVTIEPERHDEVEVYLLTVNVCTRINDNVGRIDLRILIGSLVPLLP